MSCVYLLAADKELPLVNCQEFRVKTIRKVEVGMEAGFKLEPHRYYRESVDELGYPMKHYQYELSLEADQGDLRSLRQYLSGHLSPGERVELWHLWVGTERPRPACFHGTLADFDMDTLRQFLNTEQACFTVTI